MDKDAQRKANVRLGLLLAALAMAFLAGFAAKMIWFTGR